MKGTYLIVAMLLIAGCGYQPKDISDAQSAIMRTLIDPASAQFRDVRVIDDKGWKTVCGSVNSRNRFGGYVGFQRFGYSTSDGDVWFDKQSAQDSVSRLPPGTDPIAVEMARTADQSASYIEKMWHDRCVVEVK